MGELTAEPGTTEFLEQLLGIAQASSHPIDKALATVLPQFIEEAEAEKGLAIEEQKKQDQSKRCSVNESVNK